MTDSFIDILRDRAEAQGDTAAFTFCGAGETRITYGDLERRARAIAVSLSEVTRRGDRVLLLVPPGDAYVAAFFGCMFAGVIAVPAYPPAASRANKGWSRLQAIVQNTRARVAVTTSALAQSVTAALGNPSLRIFTGDELEGGDASSYRTPRAERHEVAFLQYTSGSTGLPKGVMVSHGNLLENSEHIRAAFGHGRDDVGVIWLPPYHDMGLIGGILQPIYAGFHVHLMSPLDFIRRPLRWLERIAQHRGTISGGPNFAFEHCLSKVTSEERDRLDLSSWRVAFCGAEPVRAETVRRFAAFFEPAGFRASAFRPVYGLAEATLLVSSGTRDESLAIRRFDTAALQRATAIDAQEAGVELVGCGAPRQLVRIVDPDTHRALPDGAVGEIWTHGGSTAAGYWEDEETTRATFAAHVDGDAEAPSFLRTGDLGFLRDGQLYIAGRIKDVVIVRGRNIHPHDVEMDIEAACPSVCKGGVAAFGVDTGHEEVLVVVAEVDGAHDSEMAAEWILAMMDRVGERHDIAPADVILVRARTLPKTSSGKIQRALCREQWRNGELKRLTNVAPRRIASNTDGAAFDGLSDIERELAAIAADALGVAWVGPEDGFFALGGDSIRAAHVSALAGEAGLELDAVEILERPAVSQWADCVRGVERWRVRRHEGSAPVHALQQAVLERGPSRCAYRLFDVAAFSPEHVAMAVHASRSAHGVLRQRFHRTTREPRWSSTIDPVAAPIPMDHIDLPSGEIDLSTLAEGEVAHHEESLTAAEGSPRVRFVVFTRERRPLALLVSADAALLDESSWHAMGSDLHRALNQSAKRGAAWLPPCALSAAQLSHLVDAKWPLARDAVAPPPYLRPSRGVVHTEWATPDLQRACAAARVGLESLLVAACAVVVAEDGRARLDVHRHVPQGERALGLATYAATLDVPIEPGTSLDRAVRRIHEESLEATGGPAHSQLALCVREASSDSALPILARREFLPPFARPVPITVVATVTPRGVALEWTADDTAFARSVSTRVVQALSEWRNGVTEGGSFARLRGRFEPATVTELLPLSPMQKSMLLHSLRYPASGLYVTRVVVTLEGPFDASAFRRAWEIVVARHDALRSVFAWRGLDEPVQVILNDVPVAFEIAERLADNPPPRFDIERAPLFRVVAVPLGETFELEWSCHHLIVDGWSQGVLFRELMQAYGAVRAGRVPLLAAAPPARAPRIATDAERDACAAFWRETLAGSRTPTPLGIDERGGAETRTSTRISLSGDVVQAIDHALSRDGVTLASFCSGAWAYLLSLYSGESSVVFGTTVAGRPASTLGDDSAVGMFIDAPPVRVHVPKQGNTAEYVRAVQRHLARTRMHGGWSVQDIRSFAGLEPGGALFESLLVVETYPFDTEVAQRAAGLRVCAIEIADVNHDPLTITVFPSPGALTLEISHHVPRIHARTGARIARHLAEILEQMAQPEGRIEALALTSDLEELRPLEGTLPNEPLHHALPWEMLLERAETDGDQVAVVCGAHSMTYRTLAQRARALGGRLRDAGVREGDVVPIVACRGIEAVVGMMAIWAAGAAWSPIDAAYPDARIERILSELSPRLVLVDGPAQAAKLGEGMRALCLDEPAGPSGQDDCSVFAPSKSDIAYVIYTSGSTGRPKGIVVEYGNLAAVLCAWRSCYALNGAAVLQIGSFGADVFVGDWMKALMSGGRLVICPDGDRIDPRAVHRLLLEHGITVLESTPSFLVALLEFIYRRGLKLGALALVIFGADYLHTHDFRLILERFGSRMRIVNGYGLTECTIESSIFESRAEAVPDTRSGYVPLGTPFPSARYFVLDENGRRRPMSAVGDLYIGGPCVSRGYFGNEEATAERFREDIVPGERVYRTGDLARFGPTGVLEHFGRSDHLCKIRGHRVELGDVENVLLAVAGIREAIVIPAPDRESLWAHVVLERTADLSEIEAAVRARLPDAMVPARYFECEELPRNANGKVDRTALAERVSRPESPPPAIALSSIEGEIMALWRDVLGHERIRLDDSFLSVGGDSLKLLRLFVRLQDTLVPELEIADLFSHHTVRNLARFIETKRAMRTSNGAL